MFFYFIQGVALALPSTVLPSPLKLFLIAEALENDWQPTLPACFVPLITDGPIIIVALLILTQTPTWFLNTLLILGGFFILYLASRIIRVLWVGGPALKAPPAQAARQNLLKAVGINVFNPNPYILWFVVAGPIVLQGWREQSFWVGASLIVGFYITFILGLITLVIVFAKIGQINPKFNKILSTVIATALLLFGVYQIVTGVKALWF